MSHPFLTVFLVFLMHVSTGVLCIEEYEDMIPNNGRLIYKGQEWEASGHDIPDDGGPINAFGADFASTYGKNPWLSVCGRCGGKTLCEFDSDNDGQSNGLEMGDPCCVWAPGKAPARTTDITHPSYADATTAAVMPGNCAPVVVDNAGPGTSKRAGGIFISVAIWLAATAVSTAMVRIMRKSGVAETLRYKTVGPAWRVSSLLPFTKATWFQVIDFCGIRDFPTELFLLSRAQLILVIVFIFGLIAAFAVRISEFMDRNVPGGSRLSLAAGHVAELSFALAVLPITRNSLWVPIFGISFERAIRFHRWIGRLAVVLTAGHGFVMVKQGYILTDTVSYMDGVGGNVYGLLCGIFGGLIVVSSMDPVRRKLFELFYYLHIPLAVLCLFFGALHARYLKFLLLPPFLLWIFDLVMRFYYGRFRGGKIASVRALRAGPDSASGVISQIEVEFSGAYKHESGGYCWINLPGVSLLQWHPFSVTYLVDNNRILFHIKGAPDGQFADVLAEKALSGRSIYIDGPYGNPGVPINDYDTHLYVSGGIGVTPMLSLAQEAATASSSRRVMFMWSLRSIQAASFFVPLFENIASTCGDRVAFVVHVTSWKPGKDAPFDTSGANENKSRTKGNSRDGGRYDRSSRDDNRRNHENAIESSEAESRDDERGKGPANPVKPQRSSSSTAGKKEPYGYDESAYNDGGDHSTYQDDGGPSIDAADVVGPIPTDPGEIYARLCNCGVRVAPERPDMGSIYSDAAKMASANGGDKKIAVYACGPQMLVDSAFNTARQSRSDGFEFFVHSETFLF